MVAVSALLAVKTGGCGVEKQMLNGDVSFGRGSLGGRGVRGVALIAVVGLLAVGGVMVGCSEKKPPAVVVPAAALERYTVRGVVTALADPARKGSPYMMIHHEKIPSFKDKSGAVVGMNEMVMPFPLGPGVSAEGLAVGDKVEVVFEVDWTKAPAHYALTMSKLAEETELELGKKGEAGR